jgi:hypothetical protein
MADSASRQDAANRMAKSPVKYFQGVERDG